MSANFRDRILAARRPAALPLLLLLPLRFPLLAFLKLLRLLIVPLIHLLPLLLLAALELLLPLLIRPLPIQPLLLLDVPAFHVLALRIVLLAQPFHFSLLLLLQPGIDGSGVRRPGGGRTVFVAAAAICRRISRTACFHAVLGRPVRMGTSARRRLAMAFEFARPRSGSDVWPTVVHRGQQCAV